MKTTIKPRLLELITDPVTGRLSNTRVSALLGSLGAIVMFLCPKYLGTQSAEVWAMYLAGINGTAAYSKYLSLRFGAAASTKAKAKDDE